MKDPKSEQCADILKNYKLVNGKLFRIVDKDTTRWVVPKRARWQILRSNHDEVGHLGFDKTLCRIRSLYWFPKMRRFTKKYVAACLECAHHKLPGGPKVGHLHPIPKVNEPFHTLHADHLGPFIRSKRGNTYILVIIDAFTKFINITAVRNTKSSSSIRTFREHFSYFGTPKRLITDQGTSFTSKIFKSYIESVGVKHTLNAVATPRANGQVERYNRTILAALSTMNHDKPNGNWDEHLPSIQLGLNTMVHATTKKTPSELLFGRIITNPSDKVINEIASDISDGRTETLTSIRETAKELIDKQQEKDRSRYNERKAEAPKYSEGDLVRVIRAATGLEGQSKKLEPKCKGPYRIKKVLPNDRYVVVDTPLTRKGKAYEAIVAVDKIFPWLNFTDPGADSTNSEPEEPDDESQ